MGKARSYSHMRLGSFEMCFLYFVLAFFNDLPILFVEGVSSEFPIFLFGLLFYCRCFSLKELPCDF